ncbi:MAG: RNA-binding protein [Oscillospiraceae bacterium]|nr:RNA-binding protein [Oscillospiraceae bacterium]
MSAERDELIRRGEDLARRCELKGCLTKSGFLTPAERHALEQAPGLRGARLCFRGGYPDAERTMAFFLPEYMEEEELDLAEHICCLRIRAAFGEPGHRDYLGAILGMGVGREWVGDILVQGDTAWVLCQTSVARHLESIDKVGRYAVRAEPVPLDALPAPERRVEERRFTVMSARLDAVCAGMFRLSRSECARQIAAGNVSLNYEECVKSDAPVHEGDILSLRGAGKGRIAELGGSSRKGRMFVTAEVYR